MAEYLHTNGTIKYVGAEKDGKRDGLCLTFWETGILKYSANYTDGKRNGLFSSYDKEGRRVNEINYVDGEMDGLNIQYYPNGQARLIKTYENGLLRKALYFYKDGTSII